MIGVAFSIGFTFGPVVGVAFSKWGSSGWFAVSAVYALSLALINIVFVTFFFKETLPPVSIPEEKPIIIINGMNIF